MFFSIDHFTERYEGATVTLDNDFLPVNINLLNVSKIDLQGTLVDRKHLINLYLNQQRVNPSYVRWEA